MVRSEPSTESTRDRILRFAAQSFAEKGFAGARVDEIARRAGVNKAMLYYHVGNKEELYAAVVRSVLDFALSRFASVLSEVSDPADRVRAMTREIAMRAASQPHLPAILLREIASGGENLRDDVILELGQLFRSIALMYRDGAERGEFREIDPVVTHMVTAGSLLLLVGSLPLRERLRALGAGSPAPRSEDPVALAAEFARLLLDGVRIRKEELK